MRLVPVLVAALGVLLTVGCSEPEPVNPLVGTLAPTISCPTVRRSGGNVTLDDLRGKVVLLDFWATWCGPCLSIMPKLGGLQEKYKDKGLVVLGVTNEKLEKVEEWKANTTIPVGYELLVDVEDVAGRAYQVGSLPTTVLVGKDGKIRAYEAGVSSDTLVELEEKIKAALEEKS